MGEASAAQAEWLDTCPSLRMKPSSNPSSRAIRLRQVRTHPPGEAQCDTRRGVLQGDGTMAMAFPRERFFAETLRAIGSVGTSFLLPSPTASRRTHREVRG